MTLPKRIERLEGQTGQLLRVLAAPVPQPLPLEESADVLALLAEQANALRGDPDTTPAEKARTLGFLASVALRAIEGRDMAARLEAVERVLKLRKDAKDPRRR